MLQNREPTSQTVQMTVEVPTVPADVDNGWHIIARTACAELSSAAEAFEAAA